jgi:hypothetical protein
VGKNVLDVGTAPCKMVMFTDNLSSMYEKYDRKFCQNIRNLYHFNTAILSHPTRDMNLVTYDVHLPQSNNFVTNSPNPSTNRNTYMSLQQT